MHHVESMLKQQQTRLLLSLDDLRSFDVELTRSRAAAHPLPRPRPLPHRTLPRCPLRQ